MWGIINFLLKMVKPAPDSNSKTPSAELSTLEKDAIQHHVKAMSYMRQAIYDQAEEKALQSLNTWKEARHLGRQGGYGGHLTDNLVARQIKTLTEIYTLSRECKELSTSVFSHLHTDSFLERDELQKKTNSAPRKLIYLLHELETAGLIERREGDGKVLWRKRP